MIKVNIKKNSIIKSIKITGHALYDEHGKDIVCASVSSLVISTINGILSIDDTTIEVKNDKCIEIIVTKNDDITNKLLINMINMLKKLENLYKNNIKITEMEEQ